MEKKKSESLVEFARARGHEIGQKLTTPQLAHRYQVTVRTVQNWRDRKRIPFIRINSRCIRYDATAVDQALMK
jgi:DNA-binding transcriptional regulator YiaG